MCVCKDGDNTEEDGQEYANENNTKLSSLKEIFFVTTLKILDFELNGHEFPIEVINFCYCIYSICPHAYLLLHGVLNFH